MLQNMQNQVAEEGKKEEALFDNFMCYCKNGKGALANSIESAKVKVDGLGSSIEETAAALTQAKADLKSAQESRAAAKAAVDKATKLREKEAAAFSKESSDLKANIAATDKATSAIEKAMGGAFLQTSSASVLKQLSITMDLSNVDRDMLTSFLTSGSESSGQIIGILKQ